MSLTTFFCHSKSWGGGNLITMIVTSGVLWGSRKTSFRRSRWEGRGRDNHFREIGLKYPFLKGYIGEITKMFFCYSNLNSSNDFIEKYFWSYLVGNFTMIPKMVFNFSFDVIFMVFWRQKDVNFCHFCHFYHQIGTFSSF